jgi:cytochrome P450
MPEHGRVSEPAGPPYLVGKERVTSFTEANEILRNPEFIAGRTEDESLPFRGRTVLELDGDDHRQRRKLEVRLFVRDALERYDGEILAPAIDRCLSETCRTRDPGGLVRGDLARMSHSMFLQIAAALIGFDGVDTPERTQLLEECMYPLNAAFDVKYSTRPHDEVIAEGLAAKERFIEHFYAPAVRRRRELLDQHAEGDLGAPDLPRDLLTVMHSHHNSTWDDDLPVREAILFMAGSTDTTSNAVNHAVAELCRWLEEHPEDRACMADGEFLSGVCNEALRLHQNVTALVRRAETDVTLSTGRVISAGTFVALDLVAANTDPEVFGRDAASFNPRRGVDPPARPYGLAFGTGRHQCIGLPVVTSPSGKPPEGDRAMLKILRALVDAGVALDPERPPTYTATAEPVFATLPVILTAL